jgi:choline-sulfatase
MATQVGRTSNNGSEISSPSPLENLEEPTRERAPWVMSRRKFLGGMGSSIALGSLAYAGWRGFRLGSASASPLNPLNGKRPNIILIVTDQERYPQHWPEGWAEANLPAHNRLQQNGLTFRRHFCSTSMCSPSRSTLFTGLHPAQHGVVSTLTEGGTNSPNEPTLPVNIQTMGKMLGAAGYNIVFKGKWHISKGTDGGTPTREDVAAYGFNEWEPNSVASTIEQADFAGGCTDWDRKITDQAVEFLSDLPATPEQPFMLYVGLGNPHDVLSYPESWDECMEIDGEQCCNYAGFNLDQGISAPVTVYEDLSSKPTAHAQVRNILNLAFGLLVTPDQIVRYANFYAGLTKMVDEQVGRVLDAIPEAVRDNTIVIYTSDHGEMGMAHGALRQKAFNMYEETVNVPLIIHNPQLFPTARVTDSFASLIDLMPTLATLGQVSEPQKYTFMGHDLTPLLSDPDQLVQNEILFTFDDIYAGSANGPAHNPITGAEIPRPPKNIRAIFVHDEDDGEWKYARYFDQKGVEPPQFEMYHLRNGQGDPVDPFELDNLANKVSPYYNDPLIVAKREELAQRLQALEEERLQPLPSNDVYMPIVVSP